MATLGATGLKVSRIGLGLAALGRPGYINLGHADDLSENHSVEAMEQQTHRVLDAAWDAGVCYFDVARSYGRGEAFLGNWLRSRRIDPQAVTIGSKWGYIYTADWQVEADKHEVKNHTLPVLRQQWEQTQSLLGEYLDLYQIHSATFESGVIYNEAVLAELARLKAAGTKIGLTLSGSDQSNVLMAALEAKHDRQRLFDTVQVTWNILETATTVAIKKAHTAGMGIIVKEALANGRLTPRNSDPAFANRLLILQNQASRLETTIDALALAYVLHQPWADVVLSGAARIDHLESNLRATHVMLDQTALDALASLAEPPATYWQIRSELQWN